MNCAKASPAFPMQRYFVWTLLLQQSEKHVHISTKLIHVHNIHNMKGVRTAYTIYSYVLYVWYTCYKSLVSPHLSFLGVEIHSCFLIKFLRTSEWSCGSSSFSMAIFATHIHVGRLCQFNVLSHESSWQANVQEREKKRERERKKNITFTCIE